MKNIFFLICLIIIFVFYTSFGLSKKNTPFVCVSSYHILNSTTNSSYITHATIFATGCDYGVNPPSCGNPYYDGPIIVAPDIQYDFDNQDFSTGPTTTFVRFILTTNTSFIGKVELYIGGNLVKSNQETVASDIHGITYAIPFYCTGVTVKLLS